VTALGFVQKGMRHNNPEVEVIKNEIYKKFREERRICLLFLRLSIRIGTRNILSHTSPIYRLQALDQELSGQG
jgi:hypothetical protein